MSSIRTHFQKSIFQTDNKGKPVFAESLNNGNGSRHSSSSENLSDHCHDINGFEYINGTSPVAINSASSGLTGADDGNALANQEMLWKKIVEQNTNEIARLNRELKEQEREKLVLKESNDHLNRKLLELCEKMAKGSPIGVKVIELNFCGTKPNDFNELFREKNVKFSAY